ncbi:MAG: NERD domain-containing protein [Anaerolineaceae bacterium]|nr:NERD domain-containing protein [Anaerolineaceae bacterium]
MEKLKESFDTKNELAHQEHIADRVKENEINKERWQEKIKRNNKTLVVIGVLFGLGLVSLPLLIILISYTVDIPADNPALVTLLAAMIGRISVFSFLAIVLYLFGSLFAIPGLVLHQRSFVKKGPEKVYIPRNTDPGYQTSFWMDLERAWWSRLQSSPVAAEYVHGDIGENELVTRLANCLPDDHYCIKNLLVGKHLDADIVVVGPSGVWILESKYISGTICVRDGLWSREKEFFGPGGVPTLKEEDYEDFEKQWTREKRAVQKAIKEIYPDLISTKSGLIKGGLAFTHPDSKIDFDYSLKIDFRKGSHWVKMIFDERENAVLSEDQTLQIVDALLNRSKNISSTNSISAVDEANTVYEGKVVLIEDVLKECDLIEMTPREKRNRDLIRSFEEG